MILIKWNKFSRLRNLANDPWLTFARVEKLGQRREWKCWMAWPLISTGVLLELMKERTYPFTCALPYKYSSSYRKRRRFRIPPKLFLYFSIETLAIFIYSPPIYLNSFNNISISDIVSETCRCKCAFFSFFCRKNYYLHSFIIYKCNYS